MIQDGAYYESLYNNRAAVPEFQSFFDRWAAQSAQVRRELDVEVDVPYGDHRMETMDIFRPRGEARALLMFIHGGYWRSLDKKDHSFVAAPFVNAGAAVAAINYSLCPSVKVEDITLQCLKAGAWLYRNAGEVGSPRNRIFVAGHSAGGHLTAMCMAAQWPRYSRGLPEKVMQGGMSVSGIYDLVPIARTPSINVDVRMTEAEALKVSPAFMPRRHQGAGIYRSGWTGDRRFQGTACLAGQQLAQRYRRRHTLPGRQPLQHPRCVRQSRNRAEQGGDPDDGAVTTGSGE